MDNGALSSFAHFGIGYWVTCNIYIHTHACVHTNMYIYTFMYILSACVYFKTRVSGVWGRAQCSYKTMPLQQEARFAHD